jgi:hypothetical protein
MLYVRQGAGKFKRHGKRGWDHKIGFVLAATQR